MTISENRDSIGYYRELGIELALVYSDFKCEKCQSSENLQMHHMIMRYVKEYTDFWKYAKQRHYWGNLLVLCRKCHAETHNHGEQVLMDCISEEQINKIKKKYRCDENEQRDDQESG